MSDLTSPRARRFWVRRVRALAVGVELSRASVFATFKRPLTAAEKSLLAAADIALEEAQQRLELAALNIEALRG